VKDKVPRSNAGVRAAIFGLLLTTLLGFVVAIRCAAETNSAGSQTTQSICSILSSDSPLVEGSRVLVKGQYVAHAHGAMLQDSSCRGKVLFLRYLDGGPYFQFCESDRLSREFGCPGGKNGPIVTISGVLGRPHGSKDGLLTIERILEYVSSRTGEPVEP
jgi:hypothetical protein